jgi:N-methylhydantoinase B/oxoprolinase/acetone carboxylase alpha subunit
MNVGITAANLPTLKPLFARCFTSLRTMAGSYGSRGGRSALDAQLRSAGYMKHEGEQPFAMSSLSKRSTADQEWVKRADSDESILRKHGGGGYGRRERAARRESVRNGGIMRTTDVVITRGNSER